MKTNGKLSWWDRVMVAVTFAESGEAKTALDFLEDQTTKTKELDQCCESIEVFSDRQNNHYVSHSRG